MSSFLVFLFVLNNSLIANASIGISESSDNAVASSRGLTPFPSKNQKQVNSLTAKVDFVFMAAQSADKNSKHWTQDEKAMVCDIMQTVRKIAPGIHYRLTAYVPVKLHRISRIKANNWALAWSNHADNSMYFSDRAFMPTKPEELLRIVIHEFTHLADFGYHLSCSDDWSNACKVPMQKLKQSLSERAVAIPSEGQSEQDFLEMQKHRQLALDVGLPEPYSAVNEQECLATCLQHYLQGYCPPPEIKAYLDSELLSLPYRKEPDLRIMYEALGAANLLQAISLLTVITEKESAMRGYAFWTRAACYAKLKKFDEAIKDLGNAVKCFYNSHRIQALVHRSCFKTCVEANNIPKALEQITAAIHLTPTNAQLYLQRAGFRRKFCGEKNTELVLADYNKALSIAPRYTNALKERASYLESIGQLALAEADYSNLILLQPDDGSLYEQRGNLRVKLKNYAEAASDFEKSTKQKERRQNRGQL